MANLWLNLNSIIGYMMNLMMNLMSKHTCKIVSVAWLPCTSRTEKNASRCCLSGLTDVALFMSQLCVRTIRQFPFVLLFFRAGDVPLADTTAFTPTVASAATASASVVHHGACVPSGGDLDGGSVVHPNSQFLDCSNTTSCELVH